MNQHNRLSTKPIFTLPDFLTDFEAIAIARLGCDGTVLDANQGFALLLGTVRDQVIGQNASTHFINPSLLTLSSICDISVPETHPEEIYKGIFTLGDPTRQSRSLHGVIYRLGEELFLVAEHGVQELERIAAAVLEQNEELAIMQRALVQANRQLQNTKEEITHLMLTDPLTGLPNRRSFEQELERELKRSGRQRHPLCVAICDIDLFKHINDDYGHSIGDRILCNVGKAISANIRDADFAARWGGEEFMIIFVDTQLREALEVSERLRQAVANTHHPEIPETVTISIGVTEHHYPQPIDETLRLADRGLYTAKNNGRNQVHTVDHNQDLCFTLRSVDQTP